MNFWKMASLTNKQKKKNVIDHVKVFLQYYDNKATKQQ